MKTYIPVCTCMYWLDAVCTGMNQYILLHVSMYKNILVCTSIYQYILVHTCIYHYFLHRNPLLSCIWIQGDTRRHMAVLYGVARNVPYGMHLPEFTAVGMLGCAMRSGASRATPKYAEHSQVRSQSLGAARKRSTQRDRQGVSTRVQSPSHTPRARIKV